MRERGLNPQLSSGTEADPLMQQSDSHTGGSTHIHVHALLNMRHKDGMENKFQTVHHNHTHCTHLMWMQQQRHKSRGEKFEISTEICSGTQDSYVRSSGI